MKTALKSGRVFGVKNIKMEQLFRLFPRHLPVPLVTGYLNQTEINSEIYIRLFS